MCENTFVDGQWKQKLRCIRMPGPQGPEITEEDKTGTVTPTDAGAIEIKEQEAPKTSPIEDGNPTTQLASTNGTQNSNTDGTSKTKTTSNQAPPRTGFKYYRDLGQG